MTKKRPRVRDLGLDVWSLPPGRANLITDVPGVAAGHCTVRRGRSAPGRVKGVARTGVTVVTYPGRDPFLDPLAAAVHVINGFGKAVGLEQLRELGRIETPVAVTNTLSVWTVAEELARLTLDIHPEALSVSPVVGECNDGYLSDIRGFHVKASHVRAALRSAGRRLELGAVGAGTGMRGGGFKLGVGSASRVVRYRGKGVTVGVLTVANTGWLSNLRVGGLPVGRMLDARRRREEEKGSIIFVVATDGPFSSRQLGRLARRVTHGLARTGATSGHGSGDFAIAFSTRRAPELSRRKRSGRAAPRLVREEEISIFFDAVVEATEEAYLDAAFTCRRTDGIDGRVVEAIDTEAVAELLREAGLIARG